MLAAFYLCFFSLSPKNTHNIIYLTRSLSRFEVNGNLKNCRRRPHFFYFKNKQEPSRKEKEIFHLYNANSSAMLWMAYGFLTEARKSFGVKPLVLLFLVILSFFGVFKGPLSSLATWTFQGFLEQIRIYP